MGKGSSVILQKHKGKESLLNGQELDRIKMAGKGEIRSHFSPLLYGHYGNVGYRKMSKLALHERDGIHVQWNPAVQTPA